MNRLTTVAIEDGEKCIWVKELGGGETGYLDCDAEFLAAERLAAYEDTGLSPEAVERLNDFEQTQTGHLLKELNAEQNKHCWIPVEERLPEDGAYLCTLDGELCGLDEPFTGMCGIENGKWDEEGCVIAWQPLPEPYKEE